MRRWLFALLTGLVSAPVQADDAAHPGILLGTSEIDVSGHSPYGPISWCGELLFVRTETETALIDPETRAVLTRAVPEAVRREPFYAGLFACTEADGERILWFDDGDASIIWQTVDGSETGSVRGFYRVPFYGTPFFDVNDRTVAGVPTDGGELIAEHLPSGMKLIAVSPVRLRPPLTLDYVDGFALLRDDLVEIVTHREVPVGVNGIISYTRSGLAAVYEIDPARVPPANLHSVIIQDIMHGGEELEFPDLTVGADNLVHFVVKSESIRKECKLIGLSWGTPEVVCARLPAGRKTPTENIVKKLNTDWPLTSPSGRWVAWTEQVPIERDEDVGTVNIYLAPTADLLKP